MTKVVVRPITAEQTHPLRERVLRDGTPSSQVVFAGDHDAFHLGAFVADELAAVSSWLPAAFDHRPGRAAVRLRGMATDPQWRGSGLGGRLLTAGVERCRDDGVEVVWAHARLPALDFYRRHGFATVGSTYLDTETSGLPHQLIVLEL